MALNLTYTQKEIINLIQDIKSSNELEEIKSLLIIYLADRVTREADKAVEDKNYPSSVFEKWKNEHYRKTA
jgi:hypothetical protein